MFVNSYFPFLKSTLPRTSFLTAGSPVQAKSPTYTQMRSDLNYQSRLTSEHNLDYPSGLNPFTHIFREGYIGIGSLVPARSFLPSIPFQESIEYPISFNRDFSSSYYQSCQCFINFYTLSIQIIFLSRAYIYHIIII
ncbi:hypothetical protein V6Z12_A04G109000 [Gossypium hirsutum]